MARRIDIVSDTHGYLAPELKREIGGCDLLIHAGDITSESNWAELEVSVPAIRGVLGNNDGFYAYGPEVVRLNEFTYEGLRFAVSHFRERLPLGDVDVAVCGHTHRAMIERLDGCLVIESGVGFIAARHARAHYRALDGGGGPSSLGRDHRFIGRGCACARPFFLDG